jgi:translocator protein
MNSTPATSKWYKSLNQSPLTPPSWVFPIAWTTLYALIIASGVVFLTNGGSVRSVGFLYYCAAWVLNLSWSPAFFTYQRPDISFVIILGMLAFIIMNIRSFYSVSRLASYLLVPYVLWVSFATYLNGYIVFMNPARAAIA